MRYVASARADRCWHMPTPSASVTTCEHAENLDPPLTAREAETLSLVLAGHTDQEIASKRQQELALARDEVALLIARLTTLSPGVDSPDHGRHRRES